MSLNLFPVDLDKLRSDEAPRGQCCHEPGSLHPVQYFANWHSSTPRLCSSPGDSIRRREWSGQDDQRQYPLRPSTVHLSEILNSRVCFGIAGREPRTMRVLRARRKSNGKAYGKALQNRFPIFPLYYGGIVRLRSPRTRKQIKIMVHSATFVIISF
jgi:hypothetical protein